MSGCKEYRDLSRRQFLGRGALATAATVTMPAWLPKVAMGQTASNQDVLICIFLGGGADGLSLCVPHGDDNYYVHRSSEAIPRPDSTNANKCVDLDGFFGVSQAFNPLMESWQDDKFLFVHATGAAKAGWTRSHFDATRWSQLGKPDDLSVGNGWLARHLATSPAMSPTAPLRAISMSYGVMDLLWNAPATLPIPDPQYFGYEGWFPHQADMLAALKGAYEASTDPLKTVAKNTQTTVDLLNAIDFEHYVPAGGAQYPADSYLARGLRATAAMIRADIGVEAITMDFDGWDTHDNQGAVSGYMRDHMAELYGSLGAFYTDLMSANKKNFIVVVMSEFGRKVIQNGTGCDHGYGNAMMLMGGNVLGGRVLRQWPGLAMAQLQDQQDLKVTIDYRDILAEVVKKRLKNNNVAQIFPGYSPTYRGTVAA